MSTSESAVGDQRFKAYDHVKRHFDPVGICGEKGSLILARLAARASTPLMPLGLAVQIGLCSRSNGVLVYIFPGAKSPLSMITINCNAPQTRKSQLTNVLAEIAAVNDQAALRRASQRVDATVTKAESCILASFTEQAFFCPMQ